MPPPFHKAYAELVENLRQTATLESCAAVLGWDEQTYMPPGGAEHRANQLALLAGMCHGRATAPRVGELLNEVAQSDLVADANSPVAANIREARRDFERATKLPRRLVEELSRTCTLSQQAWIGARKQSDFKQFLPWLEKIVALKREEAQAIGYGDGAPYDALLDAFEPGMTAAEVTRLFTPLRDELVKLIAAIRDSGKTPHREITTRRYPVDAQREFSLAAARQIGFSFDEGRLDVAAHPFCSGLGPGDCRLTTRYDEHHFPGAFFGTLHEAGHGLYEQGLDRAAFGLPVGQACSLGIHESQSRMWENFVGRSRAFWQHFFPRARQAFPEALAQTSADDFYGAINDVQPSFIRVEADEATYNLHILLRFDLERPLIAGDLAPADVPGVWNETFTRYFGITPPDAARGCLQDIHWSGGMIGYFPTYALGNMYAAQFFAAAVRELGDLPGRFSRGEFSPLKDWLAENIHRRGKQFRAQQLVRVVTGEELSHEPLVRHLHEKFDELYDL
ncbi:MAG TPA: carboxypeptidase M32 [Planctomycetaceae bacterium]|nr:carboxypeptidase M32 [Planctomycetaceae bacterium]